MTEWLTKTATQMSQAISDGRLDPVDLAQAHLEAIANRDPQAQIYARVTPERAMAEAGAARDRAKSGTRLGPMDGIPASWKDLFDTAGTATEAGTRLMSGRIPDRDAEILRRATSAGMVCLGKTHLSEIAFSGLGVNPMTATSPNRAFPGHAPGGSSSGAAASLAYHLAPIAIGSDTGGSIRLPAAWNNLVGLKPTHGRLPLTGVVPLAETFDTVGPMARNVADVAMGFEALGGDRVDLGGVRLQGVQFAALDTIVMDALDPQIAAAYEQALGQIAKAGAQITHIDMPALNDAFGLAGILYTSDAWAYWGDMIAANPDAMWHHIRDRVRVGGDFAAADYLRAWTQLRAIRAQWFDLTAGYDAVLCPTVPILPPQVDRLLSDDDYYRDTNLMALRNTRVGNLMGLCGLSIPTGTSGAGLLINGLPGQEARILRLGVGIETALA